MGKCLPGSPCWSNLPYKERGIIIYDPAPCNPNECLVTLTTNCVIYNGADLPNSGIDTSDTLTIALQKIDSVLTGTGMGSVTNVSATSGTGISVLVTNPTTTPNIHIINTAPDQTVVLTEGTGIDVSGVYPSFTITNTLPDQVVTLTQGSNVTITGTYPNFTISSTAGGSGTVTSFSSGNLSPLFTTSVATATTTPALSFSLSNAGANTWFGNNTGGATTPSFNSSGSLSEATSSILSITGANTLLGNTTIEVAQADTSTSGYITSTDWNIFNNKVDPSDLLDLTVGTGLQLDSGTTYNTTVAKTISIDSTVVTLTGSQALSNKTGLISQWTNDSGYLTSAVTNVTASSPLFSSGGNTPNITIQQSSALQDGYLSSTDWSTFNNKQSTISLTTTGTSGAATFIANTLNIPQYQAAGSYVTSVSGTLNRISSTGGTTPVIDIDAAYVGQISITTLGTISTGTWSATNIAASKGGTGINSSSSTGVAQVNAGVWSVSTALSNGTTATTQSANDNSTKVATTAYIDAAIAAGTFWNYNTASTQTWSANQTYAGSSSNRLTFNFSTLGANSGVTINSTATDAASNTQKALEVLQSGANGTASQTTYGAYISNTKTGTTNTNTAIVGIATGGSTNNHAFYGVGDLLLNGFAGTSTFNLSLSKWDETTTASIGLLGNNVYINSSGAIGRENTSISRGNAFVFYTGYSGITPQAIGITNFNTSSSTFTHPMTFFQSGDVQNIAGGRYGWVTSTTDSRGSIASYIGHSAGTIQVNPTVNTIFTLPVTSGTGSTAGMQVLLNSLTTGNGIDASSSSVTTGNLAKFTSTSTVVNHVAGTNAHVTIDGSGAFSTSGKTGVGLQVKMTNTGTSSVNIAGYFSASGATANYSGYFSSGGSAATKALYVIGPNLGSGNPFFQVVNGAGTNLMYTSEVGLVLGTSSAISLDLTKTYAEWTRTFQGGGENTTGAFAFKSTTISGDASGYMELLSVGRSTGGNTTFSPSSGTRVLAWLGIGGTINQTGSASGNVYGIDYSPTVTSVLGTHYAWRNTSGQALFNGTTVTASTAVDIRGITSGSILRLANNSNTEIWDFLNDGSLQISGSAGTSGQVLTSQGAGATPIWSAASSGITVGTTTITSGTTTRIPFNDGGIYGEDSAFTWDKTNDALSIGSMDIHSTGSFNNFVGDTSGNFTLTGDHNDAFGDISGNGLTSGSYNALFGFRAGGSITTGSNNAVFGSNVSNTAITTGSNNSLFGYAAGSNITTGSNNLILGASINAQSATTSDQLSIQNAIFGSGNSSTATTISSGNLGFWATSWGTSAAKVIAHGNGTTPTTSPADCVQIYAKDISSSSEWFVLDESGFETQIS